jgi:hypothetical protein
MIRRIAPFLLTASLAFFVGRAATTDFNFDWNWRDVLPTPGPVVVEGKLWLIIVEETEDRDASLAALLRDTAWRTKLSEKEIALRVYDDDQPEAIANGYSAIAAQLGKPAVIVMKQGGEKVKVKPLPQPATPEAIDAILAEIGR